jgi:ubiquinone/menaquinone biosynthesis C-methylase UbiE
LAEFYRVLKPKGKLYLVTSIGKGEEEVHQRDGQEFIGVDSWYFYHWCSEDLRNALEGQKFVVEDWQEEEIVKDRPPCAFIKSSRH